MDILGIHFHKWEIVKNTGVTHYLACNCGKRKIDTCVGMSNCGHQPIDEEWVETGKWHVMGPPPKL